jgi:imidazolonepropionase-like amidohydrolase
MCNDFNKKINGSVCPGVRRTLLKYKKMKKYIFYLFAIVIASCSQPSEYDLVIKNVGLFNGEEDVGIVNIAINSDTIAAISTEALLSDSTIDGSGKYVIPGMVNAHVHVTTLNQVKEGYPYGILANLNMHTGLEERELRWKEISRDSTGYSLLYGAGHAATVPGGHPNQFSPDMETISDLVSIREWVDNRIAAGVDYIKIVRDNHPWFYNPSLPTLSYEQIGELISYSRGKGYKAVVHIGKAVELAEIAGLKPDGFVHIWSFKTESELTDQQWDAIRECECFIIPTAVLSKGSQNSSEEEMRDPDGRMREWAEQNFLSADETIEALRKLHEIGVLIVAGTDAPNNGINFSDDLFSELEMYQQAGMNNLEVLRTTTGNAAKAFDIEVGLLEIGSKANLVLLNGNPIDDLENLKKVEQIWKNGKTNQ